MYLLFQTVINNLILFNNYINTYFFAFFNQTNFFNITSLAIHHSNAFFQLSVFLFFIKNSHKIFMTNFIIYQCFKYFTFYLSVLFNLLLASITIFLCFFFLFLIVFKNHFTDTVVIENARLQLTLIIPTGAPIAAANDATEMLPVATDKTVIFLNTQKKQYTMIFAH